MSKFKPTEENLKIREAYSTGENLKVVAFAGTGKTSTCVDLAKQDMDKSCLYLAFNKVNATEAGERFPYNTTAMTTHSMAYRAVGANYSSAGKLSRSGPYDFTGAVCGTVGEIEKYYNLTGFDEISGKRIASLVKKTLSKYETSSDKELSHEHLAMYEINTAYNSAIRKGGTVSLSSVKTVVLETAKKLWKHRVNLSSKCIITHDTYLKLFQLSDPNLGYDVVFLDEAQDTTDVVLDIVLKQKSQIVLVGDPYQQIYAWRGAVNAMSKVNFDNELPLSQSWRYGQEVASLASLIINEGVSIKGNPSLNTTKGLVDYSECTALLYRTNSKLIMKALSLYENNPEAKIAIEIDTKDFHRKLSSVIALKYNKKKDIKHEDIKIYEDWEDLAIEANSDGELQLMVKLVREGTAFDVCDWLGNFTSHRNPDIIITTAHKSKGREFSQVVLADDFPSGYDQEGVWIGLEEEERNLLYVATTRATKRLQMNKTCYNILRQYGGSNNE